jgi:hypothetical protein
MGYHIARRRVRKTKETSLRGILAKSRCMPPCGHQSLSEQRLFPIMTTRKSISRPADAAIK